jgi:hypothetical protein
LARRRHRLSRRIHEAVNQRRFEATLYPRDPQRAEPDLATTAPEPAP